MQIKNVYLNIKIFFDKETFLNQVWIKYIVTKINLIILHETNFNLVQQDGKKCIIKV